MLTLLLINNDSLIISHPFSGSLLVRPPLLLQYYMIIFGLVGAVSTKCAFTVNSSMMPEPVSSQNQDPFSIDYSPICSQYLQRPVCCNQRQNTQMTNSFLQIDTAFGSKNGGCDVCVVNLKRFWCEYTCSERQSDFVKTYDYVKAKSYAKDKMVDVQNVSIFVQTSTACALYQSCKRTAYVAQISAMQSPAGFLHFQGMNAVDGGVQIISVSFTNDKSGLFLSDLNKCNETIGQQLHGFPVFQNCSCNSCAQKCSSGFVFKPLGVMEGFNYWLVGGTWLVVGTVVVLIQLKRKEKQRSSDYKQL